MPNKITVVGGGNVGASAMLYLAEKHLGDIVLLDILEGMPAGKALDLYEAAGVRNYGNTIVGSNDFSQMAGSDVVIITAGLPRKPGMSRSDLLGTNAKIMKSVCTEVKTHAPDAIVIVVSNPLDIMCSVAQETTGFPKERVIGMAGVLDTSRMRSFIAMELGVHPLDVTAMVLGGHGDSMVPMTRFATVSGVPVTQLIPEDRLEAIVERTRKGGGEIVALLKTGSAFYAPAASAVDMCESILNDWGRILPCAAYLDGQYGISGCYMGVPVKLNRGGLDKIIEMDLNDEELKALQASAAAVQEDLKTLATLDY